MHIYAIVGAAFKFAVYKFSKSARVGDVQMVCGGRNRAQWAPFGRYDIYVDELPVFLGSAYHERASAAPVDIDVFHRKIGIVV